MTYRDELEAAQARIQSLEEEIARLRAGERSDVLPASRRLLDELYAERDRALAQMDRGVAIQKTLALPVLALGAVGVAFFAVSPRGSSLEVPTLMIGLLGLAFGAILMLARFAYRSTREALERRHRLKIAEAEAQAEIGARVRVASSTKARIAPAGSDDDAAAEAEALADDAALDRARARR